MRSSLTLISSVLLISALFSMVALTGCGDSSSLTSPETATADRSAGEEADVMEIDITISPKTLVLESNGDLVTVHADIPLSQVASMTITLDRIPVSWTKADNHGDLVAKFGMSDVKGIVSPPEATLVLRGMTVDGVEFVGRDTVTIRPGSATIM